MILKGDDLKCAPCSSPPISSAVAATATAGAVGIPIDLVSGGAGAPRGLPAAAPL